MQPNRRLPASSFYDALLKYSTTARNAMKSTCRVDFSHVTMTYREDRDKQSSWRMRCGRKRKLATKHNDHSWKREWPLCSCATMS